MTRLLKFLAIAGIAGWLVTLGAVSVLLLDATDGPPPARAAAIVPITASASTLTPPLASSVPGLVNFQGIVTDSSGQPLSDGNHSMTFRAYDAATGGTQLWQETQSVSTDSGLFTASLGSVTPFASGLFDAAPRYLGIQVGSDPPLAPRQQFTSVPYAVHAETASSLLPQATSKTYTLFDGNIGPSETVWSGFVDTSGCRDFSLFVTDAVYQTTGPATGLDVQLHMSGDGQSRYGSGPPIRQFELDGSPGYRNVALRFISGVETVGSTYGLSYIGLLAPFAQVKITASATYPATSIKATLSCMP